MATETVGLRITENGSRKVATGFRRVDKSLAKVGRTSNKVAGSVTRGFKAAGGAARFMVASLAAAGVAVGVKNLLAFDDVLGQLQADAGLTNKEAVALRTKMLALSASVGVSKDELAAGAKVWQDYTGVLKRMTPVMGDVAKIHKATGTPMAELAQISATLIEQLGLEPKGAVRAMAKINEQAREGALNMSKLAAVLPEVLAGGAKRFGFKGERGAKQMGMMLQVTGAATGKADTAKTATLAIMRDIVKNAKKLKDMKVQVFKDGSKTDLRDMDKLMADIMKATKGVAGGKKGLNQIFGDEAMKGAAGFMGKGGRAAAAKARAAGEKGGMDTVAQQLKLKLEGVAAESMKIKAALMKLEAAFLDTGKKLLTWFAQDPAKRGAMALGAGVALKYGGGAALKGVAGLIGRLFGKGAAGALAGAAGVQKVFVVNMSGGALGGAPSTGAGAAAIGAGKRGIMGTLGYAAAAMAVPVTAGLAANAVGMAAANEKLEYYKKAYAMKTAVEKRGIIQSSVLGQAGAMAQAGKAGKTSIGTHAGNVALTQANAIEALKASAARQGASEEMIKALLPALTALTANLGNGVNVQVTAPGIDNPKVSVSRGAKK